MALSLLLPLIGKALGGLTSILGANKAANTQTAALDKAITAVQSAFGISSSFLKPYSNEGTAAMKRAYDMSKTPYFSSPITMDEASLEATPGYQFIKNQGQKSVQSGYAARGLGSSGAAMKGAANFVTGLADQTYNTRFEQERENRNDIFTRILGLAQTGEQASNSLAGLAGNAGSTIASAAVGQGNAAAGSTMAGTNAVSSLFSDASMLPYLNKLYGLAPSAAPIPKAAGMVGIK